MEFNDDVVLFKSDRINFLTSNNEKVRCNVIDVGIDENGWYLVLFFYQRNNKDLLAGELELSIEFSPLSSIIGYRSIIDYYGYWPSFHDDELIEFNEGEDFVELTINLLTKPEDEKEEKLIKIRFDGIRYRDIKYDEYTDDVISIIMDLHFEIEVEDTLTCYFYSCVGLSGTISSDKVSFRLLP
ncbi:hypothetical protein [Vallitalea sediminicola]